MNHLLPNSRPRVTGLSSARLWISGAIIYLYAFYFLNSVHQRAPKIFICEIYLLNTEIKSRPVTLLAEKLETIRVLDSNITSSLCGGKKN